MDDGRIILVRQWRNAIDKFALEIPAGAKLIDTVTIMGKQCRRIQMPNGEFLTEFGGK